MRSLKIIFFSILFFILSYIITSLICVYQYPKNEFQRVTTANSATTKGTWNFLHVENMVTPEFRQVVKPARDFLYSSAVLDASEGAYVLSIPPINRYFVFQFMEADTDVFAYIGSRTHGKDKALEVLIRPPDYKGENHGLESIELKTEKAWLLARFQIMDEADASNIHQIQEQLKLIPIKEYN